MGEKISFGKIYPFFLVLVLYLISISVLISVLGYKESFLFLNGNEYSWLDWPMFAITHLGDSLILSSIISLILVRKYPGAVIIMIIVVIVSGLLGQVLKITLFDDWDRPLRVFNESPEVHTLANYKLFHNSFPSGHSITAVAAVSTIVVLIQPMKVVQVLLSILVIVITYSRIYLGAHFPGDVLAGSIIGLLCALSIIWISYKKFKTISFGKSIINFIQVLAAVLLIVGSFGLRILFPLI